MSGLLTRALLALILSVTGALGQAGQEASDADRAKLRTAGSQHEIISILLDQGEYTSVLPAFQVILDLELNQDQEYLLVQAAWIIAEKLRSAQEYGIAHEVVDRTLLKSADVDNQFYLMMLKGKIFVEQGRLQEAVETYRQAQSLKNAR